MNDTILLGDGAHLAYRIEGDRSCPVLILSNSIATDLSMWDDNVGAFREHFRVLRFDTRGHGGSSAPAGAYSLDRLGADVLELMDRLEIQRAHFLGLSLGGFIGQWLGVHAPQRIDRLVLSNTAAHLGPRAYFDQQIAALHEGVAMEQVAETFLNNWFPAAQVQENGPVVQRFRAMILRTSPQGLAGAFAVVRDADLRRTIALIDRPTLVIGGEHDKVTLPQHSVEIAAAIPGSRLEMLPSVHLPNVEVTRAYGERVLHFLSAAWG